MSTTIETTVGDHAPLTRLPRITSSGTRSKSDNGKLDVFERSNLTRAQLVFYLGQKLHPDAPLYASIMCQYIPLRIDRGLFNQAFQKLVDHSDALRTVIEVIDGAPRQRVLSEFTFVPEYVDFSAEPDPRAAADAWCQERSKTVHVFEERLFFSALLKLGDSMYCWYINKHHIICDATSFIITARYMSYLYECAVAGSLESTRALSSFSRYVEGELVDRGAGGDPDERAYWKEQLGHKLDPVSLYGKSLMRQLGCVVKVRHELGSERTKIAKALAALDPVSAKSQPAAEFNLFAAVLLAFLHKVSGARRLSIGMPFHNRRSPEHKQTIGILIGVLPLMVDIEATDTLRSVIEKVRKQAAGGLRNSRYFFQHLMHTQAREVLLNYLAVTIPEFTGVECEVRWHTGGFGNEPLTLSFYENTTANSFGLVFDFNESFFGTEEQELVIRHFLHVFDAAVANPDAPLDAIDLVTDDERQRLLIEFNATPSEPVPDTTAHAIFEAVAEKTPNAIAVSFDNVTITYSELNRRANQLAHYLRRHGTGPDVMVGLCVERSIDMIVGILGVLKSGAAYLPLDPLYPRERLAFMIEEAHIPVLLTSDTLRTSLPPKHTNVVCLDRDWPSIAKESESNPDCVNKQSDLAYVIYTSGSTGLPKGVMIEHCSLCNLVVGSRRDYGFGPGTRLLQFFSLSFDASVCEIFGALLLGGTLCLARKESVASTHAFAELLKNQRINTALLPPSLVKTLSPADFPLLTTIITGGESCPAFVPAQWAPGRTFFNAYGPTEATVYATSAVCDGSDVLPPPIGRPIQNAQVYVLDSRQQLVPIGVPGELYIGGAGLARGYLNRPDLTEERFVPNPFIDGRSERLYRTGDVVRYRPDGQIEFLGRTDHQVKIRGFRIELGEIETVLSQHPDVAETVVVAREDVPEDHQLVAYIVPCEKNREFNGELKAQLKKMLPDYMIPSAFVVLEEMPLGPNGKVDRSALPQPDREARNVHGTAVAPRDAIELELVQIWEQVFDVRPIGVTDSFFDLGGHSLSAVFLMDQIHLRFGKVIPPSILFEAPSIEALTGVLRRRDTGEPEPVLVPIQPRGRKTPFFCVHPAPGTVFCYIELAQYLGADRPFWGIQAPSVNGANAYFRTIEETAIYYVEALKRERPTGPYILGGHSSGGVIAIEMARLLQQEGHEVELVALLDSMAPLPSPRAALLYEACQNAADDAFWLACLLMLVEYFFKTKFAIAFKDLERLPNDAQFEAVLDQLKKVSFVPPTADASVIHSLVENVRATSNAAVRYTPAKYDGNILLLHTCELFTSVPRGGRMHSLMMFFRALRRDWRTVLGGIPHVLRDSVAIARRSGLLRKIVKDPTLGWRNYSTCPIMLREVPGNHISMLIEPNVQALAANLADALESVETRGDNSSERIPEHCNRSVLT